MSRQKILILPRLHTYHGDLPKQWFAGEFTIYLKITRKLSAKSINQYNVLMLRFLSGLWNFPDKPDAIACHGKLEIVHSDQGNQFTCHLWTDYIENNNIKVSMDGKLNF